MYFLEKIYYYLFFVSISIFLVACFNEDEFDKKYDIPPSNSRANNTYTTEQFSDNASKYQSGNKEIKIGAEPLQAAFFKEGSVYFDPHLATTHTELQLSTLLFPRLVTLTPSGVVVPMIAKSWEETKLGNGYTYIFHLGDMKWGDGSTIKAKQIQASIIRALDPLVKNPYATELALAIRGASEYYGLDAAIGEESIHRLENRVQVNAVDDTTLYVTASSHQVDVLKALSHPIAAVLPIVSANHKNKDIFDLNPSTWIRKGAYVPTIIGREKIVLQAAEYWGKELWLERIEFQFIPLLEERISLFNKGEIDWVTLPLGMDDDAILGGKSNTQATQHIQSVAYAAEVFVDIPDYSILRRVFIPRKEMIKINNDLTQINYKTILSKEYQENMYAELRKNIKNIIAGLYRLQKNNQNNVFIANNIFLPNTVLPSSEDLFPSQKEEDEVIPDTFLPDEIIANTIETENNNNQSIQSLSDIENGFDDRIFDTDQRIDPEEIVAEYINTLKSFLRKGYANQSVLRVAYSDEFLKRYAEEIVRYFSDRNVPVVLVHMLPKDNPAVDTYDIAIRTSVANAHTRIGMLSKLWWLWAGNNRAPVDIFGKFGRLLEVAFYTDEEKAYLSSLNNINDDVIYTSRFVPVWYLPKKALIRVEQYPWWTGQSIYHPMYISH